MGLTFDCIWLWIACSPVTMLPHAASRAWCALYYGLRHVSAGLLPTTDTGVTINRTCHRLPLLTFAWHLQRCNKGTNLYSKGYQETDSSSEGNPCHTAIQTCIPKVARELTAPLKATRAPTTQEYINSYNFNTQCHNKQCPSNHSHMYGTYGLNINISKLYVNVARASGSLNWNSQCYVRWN